MNRDESIGVRLYEMIGEVTPEEFLRRLCWEVDRSVHNFAANGSPESIALADRWQEFLDKLHWLELSHKLFGR